MAPTSSQKSRKVKALLAGGLVLGVGAAVTLAAWTDQEWATGTFSAGTFDIEGSIDGTTWASHASSGEAAALSFELNADNLTPGDKVAEAFALRTAAGTTYGATVDLIEASSIGDNASNLSYEIFTVPAIGDCNADATAGTGTSIVSTGTAFSAGTPTATEFNLAAGSTADAGSSTVLCFQVIAGTGLIEGGDATATWGFEATSQQP
ncbi:SipW-dependent-type signal peptide-containing protein [Glutamicibacter nicotianae]|uniref:SipW-dependent-type signal peptide-containing protein n=1 Tax=Glutamicibacter nicotianae TaxID=37929 RepID=UPI0025571BE3|nr:SipW-dependent-type signal peptide-containing protein [Glutamicibacter nicotianae]WIV43609.1 SipW-dependent-type signal peptide-containing protein [Glutamicibacter nicotianae]